VTATDRGRQPPLLVLVSGAPAAGKTTLARRLAPELGLLRLCKDEVRETLGDWLPPTSPPESRALGGAAYALCFRLAAEALACGVGVVLEAAFSRGQAEPALRPLVARSRAVLLHLAAPSRLSSDRFRARHARGERHPSHMDEVTVATPGDLWERGWWRWAEPLDLGVPTLVLDTSTGYVDDLTAALRFIRTADATPKRGAPATNPDTPDEERS
jgi:predicted kinase